MKTILITGASSGIGKQLAIDYAQSGYRVVACGRNVDRLNTLAANSERIQPLVFDMTDKQDVARALQSLSVSPNIWILNAGDCKYIDHGVIDAEIFSYVLNTNVIGTVNCLEAIQHYLRPGDHLVLTGSVASVLGLPRAGAYGASKAALDYLYRSLQQDWKDKGWRLSMVMPGFVDTPLTQKNTFPMPMCISVVEASLAIRRGIAANKSYIYFPGLFTGFIRLIAVLPFRLQRWLIARLVSD